VIKALPGEIVSSRCSSAALRSSATAPVVLILNVPSILSRLSRSLPRGQSMKTRRVLVVTIPPLCGSYSVDPRARSGTVEVVVTAMDCAFALRKIAELHPDIVTLRPEMPRIDGLETLRTRLLRGAPLPYRLHHAFEEGAYSTFKALALGASEFVAKPQNAAAGNSSSGFSSARREN